VVGIHPLEETELALLSEAVILAVRRDPDGTAQWFDLAARARAREPARAVDARHVTAAPRKSSHAWRGRTERAP
jgi:hypothetical protein